MAKAKKEYQIETKRGTYRVRIWLDKRDRAYLVQCLSLPEVATFGRTLAEAKRMAKDAIELYCDCVITENKLVIDDTGRAFGKLPRTRVVALA